MGFSSNPQSTSLPHARHQNSEDKPPGDDTRLAVLCVDLKQHPQVLSVGGRGRLEPTSFFAPPCWPDDTHPEPSPAIITREEPSPDEEELTTLRRSLSSSRSFQTPLPATCVTTTTSGVAPQVPEQAYTLPSAFHAVLTRSFLSFSSQENDGVKLS